MDGQVQNSEIKTRKPKSLFWISAVSILVLIIAIGVYSYFHQKSEIEEQKTQIENLNGQIYTLESKQLPQQTFENYDDCVKNGGLDLATINAQFSGCLGGQTDETKDSGDAVVPSYQAFLQYSAENLPNLAESRISETENLVESEINTSQDLLNFLKFDYTGCETDGNQETGYFKVVKELPNRYAYIVYGCTENQKAPSSNAYIIAMKLGDKWTTISPTNGFNEKGVPSCLMMDMFIVSKTLIEKCYENSGYSNGNLREVKYD